ncbi:mechanosensitive ion channel protein MscS [Cupriavidus consociatus]|uniref:mechanosensitive ion channel protein MscS n=1 Tax=Cupriavidus consociatus TaxID=2821357 RepID=UPI001AE5FA3D|nr:MULTISPECIES: mechanosensitive ion channel protein MscS [unclassified Cupriavidus]MBP0619083.1 mechanosensitive ion channel protein MscS [Cupriavidus sp. LEh25]MDK2655728.1 mechanosensitive ion channel protein MscS [Cupriavidus sp. LEh21]
MRPSTRIVAAAALTVALVAAGPASARGRHHGGSNAGAMLAVGALVGLAFGAALASAPVVAAPVAVAPPPVTYAPAPVSYAAPAVPPGYCYSDYDRAYVPCGPQPSGYYRQQPYYGY